MTPYIEIEGRRIGPGYPVYVVAEMSANHGQDFDRAVRIVHAACEAGADAIKIQTFTPDTHTIQSDKQYFKIAGGTPWDNRTLYDLYREASMPWQWQPKLKAVADELKIHMFSSPVDPACVDFLEEIGMPAYKVASFEIVDIHLIKRIARTGKPILISTGMASLFEIDEALRTSRETGNSEIALLKCTSAYPAPPQAMNLRTIRHMSETFAVPVGLSDHTLGAEIAISAVSLGACVVEKHVTLSRDIPGPDSGFSMEPHEFKDMVRSIRNVEKALGTVSYDLTDKEKASRLFRRSLFVVKTIKKGEVFTKESVRSIRPGYGLHPRYLDLVIGRPAKKDIERGTPLSWDLF